MVKHPLVVAEGMVVSLQYVLRLEDGQEVDRSDSREPLQFLQGRGQIIAGLEKALTGMTVNDIKSVIVPPEEAYGIDDPDDYEWVPRDSFPEDMNMVEGMGIQMREKETDSVFTAYVAEIEQEQILLDYNHPLAGETLYFNVKVVNVRKATAEELAHGHAHS